MTPEQYRQVNHLCREALEREPADRATYLAEACGGDQALLREVESLLGYDARTEGMMGQAALEVAARAMAEDRAVDQAKLPDNSLIGQSMSRYRILSLLGKG